MTEAAKRILVALDTTDVNAAKALVQKLDGKVGGIKIGLEFFTANGPGGVRAVAGRRLPLFLDLKFHDIPNTVAGAVRAAVALRPTILTIHAGGGAAMMKAAVEAAAEAAARQKIERPLLVGVTVLTSLDEGDLTAVGQQGPAAEQALRLARLAQDSGLDGVVCSAREVAAIRAACGPDIRLIVPGIRPVLSAAGDQKRISSPAAAIEAGADYLVIGRPITASPDPAAAVRIMAAQMAA